MVSLLNVTNRVVGSRNECQTSFGLFCAVNPKKLNPKTLLIALLFEDDKLNDRGDNI